MPAKRKTWTPISFGAPGCLRYGGCPRFLHVSLLPWVSTFLHLFDGCPHFFTFLHLVGVHVLSFRWVSTFCPSLFLFHFDGCPHFCPHFCGCPHFSSSTFLFHFDGCPHFCFFLWVSTFLVLSFRWVSTFFISPIWWVSTFFGQPDGHPLSCLCTAVPPKNRKA